MISRRHFMQTSAAATAATLSLGAQEAVPNAAMPKARADSMILLWMAGGMAQPETFAPKRYTEFSPGLESKRVLSTFPSIPTSVDGVHLSQGLERIAKVLRFASTHTDTEAQEVSLANYISRMKPEQEQIYYVTAETFAAAKNLPHLEVFRKKGVEVLLMHDRVDEWVSQQLVEFEDKTLQSVAKGRVELGKLEDEAEKKEQEKEERESKPLLERIKKSLGESVKEVRVTMRLTDSPACLVSDSHGLGTNLERILKAAGQAVPDSKPILEINAAHPIVKRHNNETDDTRFADWSRILFDLATLAEGGSSMIQRASSSGSTS